MANGKKSRCPICSEKTSYYDTTTIARQWRALDFGLVTVHVVADVHRINCSSHGVQTEAVPWGFHNSRFSNEFEQQIAYLAIHMNKTEVLKIMRIYCKSICPIIIRVKN